MHSKSKSYLSIALIGLLFSSQIFADKTYTFGVIPQQNTKKLLRLWNPILKYLAEKTGKNITFATKKTILEFNTAVNEGAFDIIYINPYQYVQAHKAQGYVAFAHAKNKKIKGIIVTTKSSPFRSIGDIKNGAKIGLPKGAFAANYLPSAHLKKLNKFVEVQYTKNHDSGYVGVSLGVLDFAGGVVRTFNMADLAVKNKLRILWKSDGYTPHAFAIHPRVPNKLSKKVQKFMLAINDNPKLLVYLKKMKIQNLQLAQDSDWDDVRELAPFLAFAEAQEQL